MAGFSSPAQGQADGAAAAEAIKKNYLNSMAMDKLVQMYGPIAGGDPAAGLATETYLQAQKMNPLLVQQAQIINSGNAENNNYLAQRHPADVRQAQYTADSMGQTNQFNAVNNQYALNTNQATAEQAQQRTATGATNINRAGISAFIADMNQGLAAGGNPSDLFNRAIPVIAQLTGISPEVIESQRAEFLKDPPGTLAELAAALNAGAEQGQGKTTGGGTTGQTGAAAGTLDPDKMSKLLNQYSAAQVIQQRIEQLLPPDGTPGQIDAAIDSMQALIKDGQTNATLISLMADRGLGLPGVAIHNVSVVESQLGLIDLVALKGSGFSFGKATNLELQVAMKAYQNLSMNQHPQDLIDNLNTIKTFVDKMLQGPNTQLATLATQIRAGHGTVPGEDVPASQDATTPAAQGAAPQQGNQNVPRGVRNNNHGNIEDGAFAKSQPGYVGSDGRFARFESPEAGMNAMSALLDTYAGKGINTVAGVINRWAPPSENDTNSYAATVAKSLGVDQNTPINIQDPKIKAVIMQAISAVENGNYSGPAVGVPPSGAMAPPPQGQPGMMIPQALPASDTPDQAPPQMIPQPAADQRQDRFGQVGAAPQQQPAQTVVPQQQVQQPPQALIGAPGGPPLNWHAMVGETGNTVLEVMSNARAALAKNPELAAQIAQRLTELGLDPRIMQQGQ